MDSNLQKYAKNRATYGQTDISSSLCFLRLFPLSMAYHYAGTPIFEKTISFSPFASDGPPSYKDDCLPDPPVFRNPFAWDGKSPQVRAEPPKTEKLDPQALEECLRQLPQDSIEAEITRDQRAMERWGWSK